jgi:RNA polymerase sigma factor (sigma-70 family)
MIDPAYLRLLEKQDWTRIYPELVYYACEQAAAKPSWAKTKRSFEIKEDRILGTPAVMVQPMLSQGKTPEDIVQEAMQKVFEGVGKWKWDPSRQADIRVHLRWRIRGLISDLVRNKENVRQVPVPQDENGNDRFDLIGKPEPTPKPIKDLVEDAEAHPNGHLPTENSPVADVEAREVSPDDDEPDDVVNSLEASLTNDEATSKAAQAIKLACEGDADLEIVGYYIINGTPPRDIATELGLTVAVVNNLKKQFKRKLKAHLKG